MGCVYFSIDIFPYYSTFIFMVGVTARRSPRLVCAFLIVIFIILLSQQLFFCSKQQCINNKSTVCSNTSGEKTRKAQCFFVAMSERQLNYVAVYVKCDVKQPMQLMN